MIQDTSLEIYLKKVYPQLTAHQRPALHYLRNAGGTHTNGEIAEALSLPINHITPRVLELRRHGDVLESGRRKCVVTGNTAKTWRAMYQYCRRRSKSTSIRNMKDFKKLNRTSINTHCRAAIGKLNHGIDRSLLSRAVISTIAGI